MTQSVVWGAQFDEQQNSNAMRCVWRSPLYGFPEAVSQITWMSQPQFVWAKKCSSRTECAGSSQSDCGELAIQFQSANKVPVLAKIYFIFNRYEVYNVGRVQERRQGLKLISTVLAHLGFWDQIVAFQRGFGAQICLGTEEPDSLSQPSDAAGHTSDAFGQLSQAMCEDEELMPRCKLSM
eukprot:1146145-Pelagomonas_calceolata.AAC.2